MATPLRKIREAMGLKQNAVAAAVGLDQTTYSRIEGGKSYRAGADNAEKISRYFGGAVTEIHILFPERFPEFMAKHE